MNHLAIYRKYRPSSFDEVSGQQIIVNILKNAIKNNNISHAYLFAGPRGTGKTSIAKIFARTINCEELIETSACNKCQSCLNSNLKECVDILEIDAASNNGVDEIRELKSKINIVPAVLKYKVYIIDEVHMLSIGAFNALLKTLEEPPAHVIFILATTEIQKIPATIISRCQVLEFKKISLNDMKNKILDICEKEKVDISEDAINEIVKNSDGCMRDALSLLEKMISYCGKKITLNDIRTVCGKPEKKAIIEMIEIVKNKSLELCLNKINQFYNVDYDMLCIVEEIIEELDNLIFCEKKCDSSYSDILSEFIKIYDSMKKSSVNKKILFEIGILNFLGKSGDENISREIFYRTKTEQSNDIKSEIEEPKSNIKDNFLETENKKFKALRINNAFVDANKEFLKESQKKWENLKKHAFDKKNGAKVCMLLDGVPVVSNKEYIVLKYLYSALADKVNEEFYEYEKVINDLFGVNLKIIAIENDEWNKYKTEYINKINSGEKYQTIEDIYAIKNNKKSDILNINQSNDDVKIQNEDKLYELFDLNIIEIK